MYTAAALLSVLAVASAQQVGTQTPETHPKITWSKCSSGGSCTTTNAEVVIDSNWRWLHAGKSLAHESKGSGWEDSMDTTIVVPGWTMAC
jgi:cellulose 1,4-beta-cellobiosidase